MSNTAKNRVIVAALAAAAVLSSAACGGDEPAVLGSSSTTALEGVAGSRFQSSLPDLQPQSLVGLDADQVNMRLFTDRYSRVINMGDGAVREFGGVEFSTELVDFTALLAPSRAKEFEGHVGDFTVVAACTVRGVDDAYSLYLGIVPPGVATEAMISEGRNGGYLPIMDRNTNCRSWGPALPLSRMD